ncbi:MAG: flagellar biosynthetic protein FliP [SAR86 cluster bacterium]|uniref:Flagellar biosynthetic protein FliP n=1 Tax=SAR86 cluster bacterium TaxID=2030880 RepID=A0A2A4MJC8_9GAMM|nr:MAG: flagellar biosynthetic protein FliP [SAR86 cluster bacterium]
MTTAIKSGLLLSLFFAFMATHSLAQTPQLDLSQLGSLPNSFGIPAISLTTAADGSQNYSVTIQILAIMTAITLLPALLMMMTSFTRIIVVFAILRQAMGLQQTPSNQVLLGLALFLSIFIMMPVFETVNEVALQPYLSEEINATAALSEAAVPFRNFMLAQTRESDLTLFLDLANHAPISSQEELPFNVLVPAFVTSELKTAFQIGFMLFIPFLVIDLVVASVLMAMGMMMLSPIIISLPFKIMLFVLVDGWAMVIGTVAASFAV